MSDSFSCFKTNSLSIKEIEKDLNFLSKRRKKSPKEVLFCLHESLKSQAKKDPVSYSRLYLKIVSLMLGGEVNPDQLEPVLPFILANRLHYKFLALGRILHADGEDEVLFPVVDRGGTLYEVSWLSLTLRLQGPTRRYYYHDALVFETDSKGKLLDDYTVTYRGIEAFRSENAETILPFAYENPENWGGGDVLEVWTILKHASHEKPTMGVGDHCCLVLKSAEGHIYSVGKFFQGNRLRFRDYFSLFSKKIGRTLSPDLFVYYPGGARNIEKKTIRLSHDEYRQLYAAIHKKVGEKHPTFSLLQNNCVEFVEQLLEEGIGLKVSGCTPIVTYLMRLFFPAPLAKRCKRLCAKLPKWMKKGAYWLPPIYLGIFAVGCLLKLLDLKNTKGTRGSDLSFKNLFFAPWKITISHPLALREALSEI